MSDARGANRDMSEPEAQAAEPTPEQQAQRVATARKNSGRVLAALLGLEALVVLLIPRTIAFTTGLGPVRLGVVIGVAVLLVLGAGLLRRPWGIAAGSVLQIVFLATGFMIATMFLIGAIFIAIWLRVLLFRHEYGGAPGGLRMLAG